ncbi:MAG: NAD(P)H-quinone oxidoreductase [Bacteroidota bacterium]
MQAIIYDQPGGPENLYLGTAPDPVLHNGQVLVHIAASALNRADLLQREGRYPPPKGASPILGLEMAGTVIEVGEGVEDFEVGDNVCTLLNGGGYAQLAAVDQEMLLRLPRNLSFTKAAGIPEAFLTAYQALHWIGKLQKGETVLIHAGGSGVGTAAIQLVLLAGATPIITASASKHEYLQELGAASCIDYRTADFAEATLEYTQGEGANVVLDFVGGPYLEQNLKAMAKDGRMVSLAALGGARIENISLAPLLKKRLQITGTTLRSRTQDYKKRLTADFRQHAWPHFANRKLMPVVDSIYDWEEVQNAHRYMASNANLGKIILAIGAN